MRRALAWWMSAPCDERTAVVIFIAPTVLLAIVLSH
jgi:hypothetical protein